MIFRSDSRAVETTVGWIVGLEGIWCYVADWFSTVYPQPELAGYEWMFMVAGCVYAYINYKVAHSENYRLRAWMVLASAVCLAMLCITIIEHLGWRVGGVPASIFGVAVMAWSYLKIKALHYAG